MTGSVSIGVTGSQSNRWFLRRVRARSRFNAARAFSPDCTAIDLIADVVSALFMRMLSIAFSVTLRLLSTELLPKASAFDSDS